MEVITEKIEISPAGLMDLANAAKYLGVEVCTVRNLRRFRRIPYLKVGGKLRFRKMDLDKFIEQELKNK